MRADGRTPAQLRPIRFQADFVRNSTGSVLAECGQTQVICTVNIRPGVPGWMKEQQQSGGWLTAEYAMLPGATLTRNSRENKSGPSGRSSEIQRLIGRSLRAAVDLQKLGPFTIQIDCDVLNADGGTRTTAINGAMVALRLAVNKLMAAGTLSQDPVTEEIAAISVGRVAGQGLLDLCYTEDVAAEVDMNVVLTASGRYVEVQGTGEEASFSRPDLNELLDLAELGTRHIVELQRQALVGH